jgi:His-Xaa-Ser system protein HxsD
VSNAITGGNGTDSGSSIVLRFDESAYSLDAIQRAAYRYCDRVSMELRHEPGYFVCDLTSTAQEQLGDAFAGDFRTEVLDQVLRARIRTETEGIRNLVLALAFSKASIDNG